MRPELHEIERIEHYVQGTMNASDKVLFEKELAINPELKNAVDTQQLMVTAINRKALLLQVETFAPPHGPRGGSGSQSILSKFKWPIILSSIVGTAIIAWFATRNGDTPPSEEHASKLTHEVADHTKQSIPDLISDSSTEYREVDFTYVPVHPTQNVSTTRHEFGGLSSWVSPEVQTVFIDPKKDELVNCNDGTLIMVPKESFVDASGKIVTEPVALEIIEALTVDKMIGYNLTTMNGENALRSGGMIYVQPKLRNTNLSLAEGKHIHIEVPTDNYDPEMMAWEGVPDGDGNINWENPKQLENYLIPVPINTLDFLPDGFREEVQATLPFKNHRVSSTELEDSLYYALSAKTIVTPTDVPPVVDSSNNPGTAQTPNNQGGVNLAFDYPNSEDKPKFSNRNLEIQPGTGRGKARDGRGSITFTDLVANEYYELTVYFDNFTFNSEVTFSKNPKRGSVSVPRIGKCTVALQREGCDPILYSNVELGNDQITFLENTGMICDSEISDPPVVDNWVSTETANEKCYIDPAAVYAIHQEKFENTFIATREFHNRLQVLHTVKNGEECLNLYLNQLGKDLHEIDAQVASKLSGNAQNQFKNFAAQKLTNVRPDGQDFQLLKNYYAQELKNQRHEIKSRDDAYRRKSAAELGEIKKQFDALSQSFKEKQRNVIQKYAPSGSNTFGVAPPINPAPVTSRFVNTFKRTNSQPNVARQASYKVNWFGTGWMNIDAYLKQLSNGERIVALNVSDEREGQKVYTTINSLKTVIPLNKMGASYEAHFPKFGAQEEFKNSAAYAIKRNSSDRLEMAVVTYNPYVRSNVTINDWKEYSEKEFMRVLKNLNPATQQLVIQMGREKIRIQKEEERRKRALELEQQKQAELSALEEEFSAQQEALGAKQKQLLEKQEKARLYIQNLEDQINPCHPAYTSDRERQSFGNKVEDPRLRGAEFPGGQFAMQRFIVDNLDYPEEAIENGIQGTVRIELIIDPGGNITSRRVMNPKPGMELLEAEALRIVGIMPKWKPGSNKDGPVGIRETFPINFVLEE